ncbi:MAG TPA: MBL fold metallo-hydrolase [Solirubrobacteraceae bacterium]|jgi:glyoxylase-like metal-dependent hydrolase (beta-lactamase superfamily II)|nr:MBL fold metallo-hydrolase [Solirubrobacteraceae bacterium]
MSDPSQREGEERAEAELLAQAAEAGIHRLAIPTPFQVGRVNAYLIEDSPLTLIDSGPSSERSLQELERGLGARGHAIEDIELLVITHQHVDHFGLAATLAQRSGAEVAALEGLAPYLHEFETATELDDRFAQSVMLRHGIPADLITALRAVSASFRTWGAAVEVTRPVRDGEELRLRDRTLRVLHRPGHSPSDTVFLDDRSEVGRRAIMFAADHLLANISSNPLLARPLDAGPAFTGPRPRALIDYMASLERTRAMDLSLVLPGHGTPIADHASLIDSRLFMHRRRAESIHGLIAAQPRTAHEIAVELWGNVAVTQAYLTLSEVLGHVDLLLDERRVVERADSDEVIIRFEAV